MSCGTAARISLCWAAGPIVERKPTRPVNAHDACALTAEEFVSEGFNQLGLKRSYVVGEQNRKQLSECITMDRDLMVASRCPSPNERAKAHPVHWRSVPPLKAKWTESSVHFCFP